jgi:hypothetical protein
MPWLAERQRTVICPTGKSPISLSSPPRKNISLSPSGKSSLEVCAIPASLEGRIAIVTDVGLGMRWTRQRRKTGGAFADGEDVWSWRPDAGVKFREVIREATVARKPGHRGERGISRKPLRREGRVIPVNLW